MWRRSQNTFYQKGQKRKNIGETGTRNSKGRKSERRGRKEKERSESGWPPSVERVREHFLPKSTKEEEHRREKGEKEQRKKKRETREKGERTE